MSASDAFLGKMIESDEESTPPPSSPSVESYESGDDPVNDPDNHDWPNDLDDDDNPHLPPLPAMVTHGLTHREDLKQDFRNQRCMQDDAIAQSSVRPVKHIYVRPVCYRQTGKQRFGEEAHKAIRAFVMEHHLIASTEGPVDPQPAESDDSGSDAEDSEFGGVIVPSPAMQVWADHLDLQLHEYSDSEFEFDENAEYVPDPDDSDESDPNPAVPTAFKPEQLFPRMQRGRMCLTVLSQHFDLYFAAYQDKIYVYRPQQPPIILPDECLILRPRQSALGKRVRGYQNRGFGHQMNQIKTGELGELEVLVACYDDGDVVAYYTHVIAEYITGRAANPTMGTPKPFFRSNVGKSAWGVAIHKQSRLLAVSSNKHEVTVFALSISSKEKEEGFGPKTKADTSISDSAVATTLEKHMRSRTRTWHIILSAGSGAKNMPSVAFCDGADGNAERLLAADIGGNLWIMDIWKIGAHVEAYPYERHKMDANIGWGVLVLSDDDFKPVSSFCEALGVPLPQVMDTECNWPGERFSRHDFWDITCSAFYVVDSAPCPYEQLMQDFDTLYCEHHFRTIPVNRRNPDNRALAPPAEVDDGKYLDGLEDEYDRKPADDNTTLPGAAQGSDRHLHGTVNGLLGRGTLGANGDEQQEASVVDRLFSPIEQQENLNLSRIIAPGAGQLEAGTMAPNDMKCLLDRDLYRAAKTRVKPFKDLKPSRHDTSMSIFLTSQAAVMLHPLTFRKAHVIKCESVLPSHNHHAAWHPGFNPNDPWDMDPAWANRISMIQHVPELYMVVCGSLNGRVALITLTKYTDANESFRRGFRVEATLPRRKEEEKRMRMQVPLHGMAISPVPDHKARGLALRRPGDDRGPTGRLYRLILHYLDHSILMYHIARSEKDAELQIF